MGEARTLAAGPFDGAPALSVVVPTHGRPAFLRRALESVFAQDGVVREAIVVDDNGAGSARQRETEAVLAALADAAPCRLRYVVNAENLGGGAARNAGVACADAPFVAFLDDDDEWLPGHAAAALAALGRDGADVAYCDCHVQHENGARELEVNVKHEGDVWLALLGGWCPSSTSLFTLRRERLAADGPFDPALAGFQDYDCWLSLARRCRFVAFEPASVVRHRHDGVRITTNTTARRASLAYLEAKWSAELSSDAERAAFARSVARLEGGIREFEYRNALAAGAPLVAVKAAARVVTRAERPARAFARVVREAFRRVGSRA